MGWNIYQRNGSSSTIQIAENIAPEDAITLVEEHKKAFIDREWGSVCFGPQFVRYTAPDGRFVEIYAKQD